MCATPNTSSPSATWGPRETGSSLATLTFLGGYIQITVSASIPISASVPPNFHPNPSGTFRRD